MIYTTVYKTENKVIGDLILTSDGENLCGVFMDIYKFKPLDLSKNQSVADDSLFVFSLAKEWLCDYFDGGSPSVSDLPLLPNGTKFQKLIWKMLCKIPYGEIVTYGSLAKEAAVLLGKEKMSSRAVGGAVGSNPISIIIPCHRVVGAEKKLVGYGAGIERKVWLLKHEGIDLCGFHFPK